MRLILTRRAAGAVGLTRMNLLELNHVALHVKDVANSSRFYRRILKLTPIPRPTFDFPGAWFRLGVHQELHLIGGRNQEVRFRDRGTHFALMVDDLNAWETHFRTHEIPFLPRRHRPDGAIQIYVADPDGYVIELFIPPVME